MTYPTTPTESLGEALPRGEPYPNPTDSDLRNPMFNAIWAAGAGGNIGYQSSFTPRSSNKVNAAIKASPIMSRPFGVSPDAKPSSTLALGGTPDGILNCESSSSSL